MQELVERVDVSHYTYRVTWSAEDQEHVATCVEFPSLSWLDKDQVQALEGIRGVVASVIEDMEDSGETVPVPLSERSFSGNFVVRLSSELHRKISMEAAEQHVSLNRFVEERLASCV